MPELPEVETVRRGLALAMEGRTIAAIKTHRAGLRTPFPKGLAALEGKKIAKLDRRAKYILIRFAKSDAVLVLHLGMSGRMTIVHDMAAHEIGKHDHFVIELEDGAGIVFNDPRRFGQVMLLKEAALETDKAFKSLSPEPLSKAFSPAYLAGRFKTKKVAVKVALLDQHVAAGVGNIYACEALFAARIGPKRLCDSLSRAEVARLVPAIKKVLLKSIDAGGSTLKDYRHADGALGYFQHSFSVYGRAGKPCPRCAGDGKKVQIIEQIVQAGRSTFYCPHCQK